MKKYLFLLLAVSFFKPGFSQQQIQWRQPQFVEGVCVLDSSNIFHRLPVEMKEEVRKPVWDLSEIPPVNSFILKLPQQKSQFDIHWPVRIFPCRTCLQQAKVVWIYMQ
jgi:hypothetical protein